MCKSVGNALHGLYGCSDVCAYSIGLSTIRIAVVFQRAHLILAGVHLALEPQTVSLAVDDLLPFALSANGTSSPI